MNQTDIANKALKILSEPVDGPVIDLGMMKIEFLLPHELLVEMRDGPQ